MNNKKIFIIFSFIFSLSSDMHASAKNLIKGALATAYVQLNVMTVQDFTKLPQPSTEYSQKVIVTAHNTYNSLLKIASELQNYINEVLAKNEANADAVLAAHPELLYPEEDKDKDNL